MARSNTETTYGSVAQALHWLTALLIVTAIPLGVIAHEMPVTGADGLPDSAAIAWVALLFSLHKTLGVSIFFVAVARILWAVTQQKPAALHADRKLETLAAETVHWLLYGSLVIVPLSGWIHHAATAGFAPIWGPFGQSLPFVPKDESVAAFFKGLHGVFSKVLIASILLHVAGALKHVVIDKDETLRRMLPGRGFAKHAAPHKPSRAPALLPVIAALGVWVAALGAGTLVGVFTPANEAQATGATASNAPALMTAVESDWQVESGALTLNIVQFGTPLSGRFEDWTSDISFEPDPDAPVGAVLGQVTVLINTTSLRLGSVTEQAAGPDFFDSARFAVARFEADIVVAESGYIAKGTLEIKEQVVAISLPFTLAIEGDTAQMRGEMALDRRDFNIGNALPNEGTLSFAVGLEIALSATR